MREHRILTYCDVHMHRDESSRVEAQTSLLLAVAPVESSAYKPKRVDVCAECMGELAGLVEVLDERGVTPDTAPSNGAAPARTSRAKGAPSSAPDPGECVLCGHHYSWLATHYGTNHGLTLKSCQTAAGYVCPSCGDTFEGGQGLASHVVSVHESRVPYLLADLQAKPPRRKRAAS